jgi:hypothetical protein
MGNFRNNDRSFRDRPRSSFGGRGNFRDGGRGNFLGYKLGLTATPKDYLKKLKKI